MPPDALGPEELRSRWIELEGAQAPKVPLALMRRLYAQRISERAFGGIPDWVLAEFEGILAEHRNPKPARRVDAARRTLSVGTRLVREWNGRTISVDVQGESYIWNDQHYGSLSEIARAVTGTRWSGPRFFGVTGRG